MKFVTVVGARPQFIKAAAVTRAIQAFNQQCLSSGRSRSKNMIQEIWVHTGQHYDYLMDKIFFKELELPIPHYQLGVGSGSHARQTGMMLERIEAVIEKEKPDVVIVYGDTNSTLAGALASTKLNIPVAHVEAGLRSFNRSMPEEVNRVVTDHLSTFLFCPAAQAVQNLFKEGIKDGKGKVVKKVGDVMYDSILYYSKLAERRSTILKDLKLVDLNGKSIPHSAFHIPQYYLATLHRSENTDNPTKLKSILKALNEIGKKTPVILPLHPRTKKMMRVYRLLPVAQKIKWIDPVSYFDMLQLEMNAKAILTDSGGVQKEAYWLKVPCFTLREETEWVETVQQGWNKLVGADMEKMVETVGRFKGKRLPRMRPGIFGDGRASEKIVQVIIKHIGMKG